MSLISYINGVSFIGPGIRDWRTAEHIFSGLNPYIPGATELPAPMSLPAPERRRAGRAIKLAISLGMEASAQAALDPKTVLTVFSSSGGDGENCDAICRTLASDRQLSPTRFHHSVHNVPAGYWSIATGAMAASTTLCAHDASFAAGLLEAMTQVTTSAAPVLLIAYDTPYPPPLNDKRPIRHVLGIALALDKLPGPRSIAKISAQLGDSPVDRLNNSILDDLRSGAPAGGGLSLLVRLARRHWGSVHLEYFDKTTLTVSVNSC